MQKNSNRWNRMINVSQLQVVRDGKIICHVKELSLEEDDRIAVIGSNGSGKTTLLRVLAGLEKDFQGTCRVGVDFQQRTYLHQHPYLFRGAVLNNVQYGERERDEGDKSATEWLGELGVDQLANRSTRNLSGGEVRRVALARALACQSRLLLLDEPLADLDQEAIETVCRVLNELTDVTLVIASPTALPSELGMKSFDLDLSEIKK